MMLELAILTLSAVAVISILAHSHSFRQRLKRIFSADSCIQILMAKHAIRSYQKQQKKKLGIEITENNIFKFLQIPDKEWELDGFKTPDDSDSGICMSDSTTVHGTNIEGDHLLIKLEKLKPFGDSSRNFILIFKYKNVVYTLPRLPGNVIERFTCDSKNRILKGNGLTMEVVEPFRRWRILFHGYLRKVIPSTSINSVSQLEAQLVYARLVFRWSCNTNLYCSSTDTKENLIIQGLSKQKNFSKQNLTKALNESPLHLEQWGQLLGTVALGENPEAVILLRGIRRRFKRSKMMNIAESLNYYTNEGRMASVGHVKNQSANLTIPYGCLMQPYRSAFPIKSANLEEFNLEFPSDNYLRFSTDQSSYMVKTTSCLKIPTCDSTSTCCSISLCQFVVNNENAWGFHEIENSKCEVKYSESVPVKVDTEVIETTKNKDVNFADESNFLTLPLDHRSCKREDITGGKGSNLAQLVSLQSEFVVPKGFVITTIAHRAFLEKHPQLQSFIKIQLATSKERSEKTLAESCNRIKSLFETCDIGPKLRKTIFDELGRQFGDLKKTKFAVRSSAVGEDGSDLSTAGQMDTILDVEHNQLERAILRCWASQFSHILVEYKIQHGQSLEDSMAVVIQEMVQPESAGVLFTCHPVTQDPLRIVVNAAFGVGEAVVSGNTQPDSFVVKRNYYDEKLTIESRELAIEGIPSTLSDKVLMKLCQIGVEIEGSFGHPVDIEWALDSEGVFHILQSRPITTMDTETMFEMLHEFDSGTVSETDYYTIGNVGEVMPKAQSPLSISAGLPCLDKALQWFFTKQYGMVPYAFRQLGIYRNRGFLNLMDGFYASVGWLTSDKRRAPEVIMLGHPVTSFPVGEDTKRRYVERSKIHQLYEIVTILKCALWNNLDEQVSRLHKIWNEYEVGKEIGDPGRLLKEIQQHAEQSLVHVWQVHLSTTSASSMWYNVGIECLFGNKLEWSPEHYTDISNLYSTAGDVVSADVPAAIQKLAYTIFCSSEKDKFISMDDIAEAVSWLRTSGPTNVVSEFNSFLDRHGHRCLREIDLAAKAWEMDPSPLVPILQGMVKNDRCFKAKKVNFSPSEAIDMLKTPVSNGKKRFLRFVIPRARKAVAMRENTKSLAIKVNHKMRKAYLRLGEMLQSQGKLPDPWLIFYLTVAEIEVLTNERSAKIVALSVRRKKIMQDQDDQIYPEIMRSYPVPLDMDTLSLDPVSVIFGTPVCQGCIVGKARVALTSEEASVSQDGDILITKSTDIGWSPYFPLVSGVVTEIGGLLSHGAVVAREYGLPCLINAINATKLVKTGDVVRLDANKGRLEIIERI